MKKIGIVLGSFHKDMVGQMLEAAKEAAAVHGLEIVEEIWVPGSVEKPLALHRLLKREDIDGAIALGIIERGETKHGFVMGQAFMQSAMNLMIQHEKPIGVGVLGPEILPSQIPVRLNPYAKKAIEAVAVMLK